MTTNLKPADELFSVREKIKMLQAREKEIKAGMMDGTMPMDGDFAVARLIKSRSSRFDRKACEAKHGDLSEFVVTSETTVLRVDELVAPEELVE